jgi:hypothetical protein
MATTPLYKRLKENGTSFYVFPSSAEDISASYQNQNYKMYFSKFALLNFPSQNLVDLGGTQSEYITFDFSNFSTVSPNPTQNFSEQIIESLRNYVANHEVTIRQSRVNNTDYYYDPTDLQTTSEKIFFKWCKKLGVVSFEPAVPQDEYFSNLPEFERGNLNDDSYFREYLWREREISEFAINLFDDNSGNLRLTLNGVSNLRVGDIAELIDVSEDLVFDVGATGSSFRGRVTQVDFDGSDNHEITLDLPFVNGPYPTNGARVRIYYHRLIQYIGEVNGVSNVQQSNRSYTEVYAHVPDHTGKTPDILFRTSIDQNYKPGLIFPIIPNQYQPEIVGAELFSSPIVNDPNSYPGSYYGQFDSPDFTYLVQNGDSIRRSGDYYGVTGDINDPVVDGGTVDGITVDFDKQHYVKMNIRDREISTFDQFNALQVNNAPPEDFEFNAILWFYETQDANGNSRTNLYGISFLDNPENNPIPEDLGVRFPIYKKLVTNGEQDGTSYAFALNLNFNITSDNVVEAYNPDAVNSLFTMNLFNKAMSRLANANDSFLNIISEQQTIREQILGLKQLLYSQTDIATINSRISTLDGLLRLYSTNQFVSSDTIDVELIEDLSPPVIRLNSIDKGYIVVTNYDTSNMYSSTGIIPVEVIPPTDKDFMIKVTNNDEVNISLDDNLKILISNDLKFRQTMDMVITGSEFSSQNKKLDLYITTINPLGNQIEVELDDVGENIVTSPVESLIIGDIDLPVFYNQIQTQPNSAKTWKKFNFNIDFNEDIELLPNGTLTFDLEGNGPIISNSIKVGDTIVLNNLFVGTTSVFDFSGQYEVDAIAGNTITLDVSTNEDFIAYASGSLPLLVHSSSSTILSNTPYISLNKGLFIRITRISELEQVPFDQKYFVDIRDLDY